MSSKRVFGKEVSGEQAAQHEWSVERARSFRSTCPECDGGIVAGRFDSHCESCGLVVSEEHVDQGPTLADLGITGPDGFANGYSEDKSIERVNPFRSGKSLGSIFWHKDIEKCRVSGERSRKLNRMLKWHRRHSYNGNRSRSKRLDDVFHDVELLKGELAIPEYVAVDAASWMRQAKDARLPGGHMAWESLAAGAVALAARNAGIPRATTEVAEYAKTSHERVCAAARKIRIELDLDVPPLRSECVEAVLDAVDDELLDGRAYLKLAVLGRHLVELADENGIGPGTPRLTVAASAVYAANRLIGKQWLTQPAVVEAGSTIVEMSTSKIGKYSRELYTAYVERHGTDDPSPVLDNDRFRLG